MLLYGRLREVEAPAYLGVRESLYHVTQDLPLAHREGGEVAGLILGQHVPEQLPGCDELPPFGRCQGAYELVWHHLGVDETGGSCLQGAVGEWQVELGAENHNRWRIRAQLPVELHALGETFRAVGEEYDASWDVPRWLDSLVNPGPLLQGPHEPGAHDRAGGVDPDQAKGLGPFLRLAHHVRDPGCRMGMEHPLRRALLLLPTPFVGSAYGWELLVSAR